jgi:hypothetical protein
LAAKIEGFLAVAFGLSDGGLNAADGIRAVALRGEIEPNLRGRWFGAEQD